MDFCGRGFVQPRSLTELGLRMNPNKRIKLEDGGEMFALHCLAKFSDFSCALMCKVLICSFSAALADGFGGKNENFALKKQIKMSDQCLHCIYLK